MDFWTKSAKRSKTKKEHDHEILHIRNSVREF